LSNERVERRLAAILAADVAGYSRLMGANEEGTLAQLKAIRKALVDPTIAAHRGRIVKTTGDGMLVEFASAVDAARCAVEVQREREMQNTDVRHDLRIEFRIGIHVGDIIIDDNDIFGDGVNIAARLEGIAEPGGVCISDDAQRQIRGKVDIAFEDMGLQNLKNITEPMRAWRLRINASAPAAAMLKQPVETIQTLALPDKPSIAVLPFQNMSGDPEQNFFCRRDSGGHHHGTVSFQGAVRHRPQFELHIQGARCRREADRAGAWGALRIGRERSQSGKPSAHHGTTRRYRHWGASLGGPV
jgi:adenylate cyclase